MNTIIRARGGKAEHVVNVDTIMVPDLWHLAMALHQEDQKDVLECWHLCHDLLRAVKDAPDDLPFQ